MEIVSEGSLESISRPSSSGKRCSSRSSIRSSCLPVHGSLDILPSEEPLNVVDFELEEDVLINNSNSSEEDLSVLQDTKHLDEDKSGVESCMSENETLIDDNSHDFEMSDPKIQKGLEKIKKLDAVLVEKVKKEKEVKKQRLYQEQLWREELDHLEQARDLEQLGKQVDLGPAHMLALGTADNADESICDGGEDGEEDVVVTPLFATQPTIDDNHHKQHNVKQRSDIHGNIKQYHNNDASEDDGYKENEEGNEKRKNKKNNKTTRKKDYIKRNIQLAADANNTIAMTEEEKQRLEELLSDMGNLLDDDRCEKELASLSFHGEGYRPTAEEIQQLNDIDFKLRSLLPAEEFDVLCSSSLSSQHTISEVHTPRSDASKGTLNEESQTFGEIVLQETKDMREMKERLLAIENELERFRNFDYDQSILSQSLLRQLLDESSRTTSEASTTIPDRISSVTMSVSCDFDDRGTSSTME